MEVSRSARDGPGGVGERVAHGGRARKRAPGEDANVALLARGGGELELGTLRREAVVAEGPSEESGREEGDVGEASSGFCREGDAIHLGVARIERAEATRLDAHADALPRVVIRAGGSCAPEAGRGQKRQTRRETRDERAERLSLDRRGVRGRYGVIHRGRYNPREAAGRCERRVRGLLAKGRACSKASCAETRTVTLGACAGDIGRFARPRLEA